MEGIGAKFSQSLDRISAGTDNIAGALEHRFAYRYQDLFVIHQQNPLAISAEDGALVRPSRFSRPFVGTEEEMKGRPVPGSL